MKQSLGVLIAVITLAAPPVAAPLAAWAQTETADQQLIGRIYRVADLVLPTPNYAFEGVFLPRLGTPTGGVGGMGAGMGGGMGAGMGGMSGMGGGFFQVAESAGGGDNAGGTGMGGMGGMGMGAMQPTSRPLQPGYTLRLTLDDLVSAITSTVDRQSWEERGGSASICVLGGMLLVNQTEQAHEKIGRLLNDLRREGGSIRSVTIRVHWLLLNTEQARVLAGPAGGSPGVDRAVLNNLAGGAASRGQITCFDGQTVHIISGQLRHRRDIGHTRRGSVGGAGVGPAAGPGLAERAGPGVHCLAQSVSPRDYLAQQLGGPVGSAAPAPADAPDASRLAYQPRVGYQPVIQTVHYGALLQITPTLIPQSQQVVLDLQSYVTLPSEVPRQAVPYGLPLSYGLPLALDRLDLTAHQFMTTLHLPLGQPTLVGGATLRPMSNDDLQLYLVVEVTVEGGETGE